MEVVTAAPFDFLGPHSAALMLSAVTEGLVLDMAVSSSTTCEPMIHQPQPSPPPIRPSQDGASGQSKKKQKKKKLNPDVIQRPLTPPKALTRPTKRFDKLLVLDLDGTLVHSEFAPRPTNDHHFSLFNEEIFVYKRPGLDAFIRTCLQWFDVAVWTASGCEYAAQIVKHIFPEEGAELAFLFSSSRCTNKYCPITGDRTIIKDLKKVKRKGYDLRKMLIVDDTPSTFRRNYGNAVYIQPYWGTKVDDSLPLLVRYLETIGESENVRSLDKRNWVREAVSLLAKELTVGVVGSHHQHSASAATTASPFVRLASDEL